MLFSSLPRRAARIARVVMVPGLAVPLGVIALPAAHAQMGMNPTQPMMPAPRRQKQAPEKPAPPALPGAQIPQGESVNQSALDNEDPTKVLFSAINQGNYAEARAAVARGANLQASNALGETPVALSVALGRNAITFMLLSVLHEGGAVASNPATSSKAGAPKTNVASAPHSKSVPHGRVTHTNRAEPARRVMADSAGTRKLSAPPAGAATATPDPSAGFLGFDNNP